MGLTLTVGSMAMHLHHGGQQLVTLFKRRPNKKWKVFTNQRVFYIVPEKHLMPVPEEWNVNADSK